MFYSWWNGIFIIVSIVVLFIAWSRCLTAKGVVTSEHQSKLWAVFRVLILIGLIYEVALFIVGIVDLPRVFAYMASIFLAYLSITFLWGVTFFVSVIGGKGKGVRAESQAAAGHGPGCPSEELMRKTQQDMRGVLAVISSMAESLRDHGAEGPDDLKDVASTMVTHAKQLGTLIDKVH